MNALPTNRSDNDLVVDWMQYHLGKQPQVEMPLTHRFTPGLYVREIFMPKGTVVISRVHKTEHPYAVLQGRASVWVDGGIVECRAGDIGVTKPGTRRVLLILEDCRWATFHPTGETDLKKLEEQLTETPDVSYVGNEVQKLLEHHNAKANP
jgi:mannose-6-phosphate isomerase-like protein (cupin superfamily)